MGSDAPKHKAERQADREELLAELLEQLITQSKHGKSPDIDAVAGEHPELADELRQLWATAMIAEGFGSLSGELSPLTSDAASTAGPAMPQRIGKSEPLEEIGRGGMGVVYKAKQIDNGETVALKMILRGGLASAADVARFRAEAESASRLKHPHIVPVYDVGEHDGQPYFSMQHIQGTTLAKRLAEGPISAREAAQLLVPVCRAIAEAHRNGVLHRDLKPSNILIDGDGQPFVSDFGLAKRITHEAPPGSQPDAVWAAGVTQSTDILGTPGYMAPEQAAGRQGKIGPGTDVYSLGGILYAMLTSRPPFQGATPVDTILMVLQEQAPILPRLLNPTADAELEMIALKCLQKQSDLRYRDADALADDLEAFLQHKPIAARSSKFSQIISRTFQESYHAAVLENWGLLWMLHSLVLLVLCLVTNGFQLSGVTARVPYLGLWVGVLGLWAVIFWNLRRRAGPITFVERQIAHTWAGSMIASTLLFAVEWFLDLMVLQLSPVLGLISGMVFLVKAGILSGAFYVQAVILFLTGVAMAVLQYTTRNDPGVPDFSIALFGVVSAGCFFWPGLKYYRQQRQRSEAARPANS